jgi:serine protease AprX
MKKQVTGPSRTSNWGGPVRQLILLALFLPLFGTTPAVGAPLHVQPALLQAAAQHPGSTMNVIVQKNVADNRVEDTVIRLGGQVTKNLYIINAFAAAVPASSIETLARADGVRWLSLDGPVKQSSISAMFTTWATQPGVQATGGFTNTASLMDSAPGPNGTYAYASNGTVSLAGFESEETPGNAITKVEVVLRAYVPVQLGPDEDPSLTAYVSGQPGTGVVVDHHTFDPYVGQANAGTIYVDITASRSWTWGDFNNGLELLISQTGFSTSHYIYYDSVGLRVTSNAGNDQSGDGTRTIPPASTIDTSRLTNAYDSAVRATDVWNGAPGYYQGQGISVAVVDSGILNTRDLSHRIAAKANFNSQAHNSNDGYGHGTFVAGLVAGDGTDSQGAYIGIAPKANLLNVRVSDDQGVSLESDVVHGLQWVYENKARYNIRVANLSLNSTTAQSSDTSPLDAACEVLWFNGIVVVVSAGNSGSLNIFPPANDPFVVTVGATNDHGTAGIADDTVAPFSAFGITESGVSKPDLVAPGTNLVSLLPSNGRVTISQQHSANRVNSNYFRMSGTSMAAPIVSGAAAILLQSNPSLTPDQVKNRLKQSADRNLLNWPAYNPLTTGSGYLDIYAAVHSASTLSANTGLAASQLLLTGLHPLLWQSVNWDSVNWDSVNWDSVNWDSVNWDSVNWDSDYWGQ